MWSKVVIFVIIGLAAATKHPWKSGREYEYQITGRTLTGLHDLAQQFSGTLFRAKLVLVNNGSSNFVETSLKQMEFADVHAFLPGGWDSHIPNSQLSWKELSLSGKPLLIEYRGEQIHDLLLNGRVTNPTDAIPNWEVNLYRAVLSQFQLDISGENLLPNSINYLSSETNSRTFKTMEETITGKFETLYNIKTFPSYFLKNQPWLVPKPELVQSGKVFEVLKSKNYNNHESMPSYHYGLSKGLFSHRSLSHGPSGLSSDEFSSKENWEPNSNKMGDWFLRSSKSRAILSGSLQDYLVQSSMTTNKIIISPTLNSQEKGMVVSGVNATLVEIRAKSNSQSTIGKSSSKTSDSSTTRIGGLVYVYDQPFAPNHERDFLPKSSSSKPFKPTKQNSIMEDLTRPPNIPLLPYFVGYKGRAVKFSQVMHIIESLSSLAQKLGTDFNDGENIPKHDTLGLYITLTSLLRTMTVEELKSVEFMLEVKNWYLGHKIFFDALAECLTGPALLTMLEVIRTGTLSGEHGAEAIASLCENVRVPTLTYIIQLQSLLRYEAVLTQPEAFEAAYLGFTTLIHRVFIDQKASKLEYPTEIFGNFSVRAGEDFVVNELIPQLTKGLYQAMTKVHQEKETGHPSGKKFQNSKRTAGKVDQEKDYPGIEETFKIHIYIRALGNIGHQKILPAFEPFLEGTKPASNFQRFLMVSSLDRLSEIKPKIVQNVLFRIYENLGESSDVRAAAVYQLLGTDPSAEMLQRMAEYTHTDNSERVNSAVRSSIWTASRLEGAQYEKLRSSAQAAQPILAAYDQGSQYSHNNLHSYIIHQMNTIYQTNFATISNEYSYFPKSMKLVAQTFLGGSRRTMMDTQTMVSSISDILDFVSRMEDDNIADLKKQKQQTSQYTDKMWSSEYITNILGIKNEENEPVEGAGWFKFGSTRRMFSFSNQTLGKLPQYIKQLEDYLKTRQSFDFTKAMNRYEMAIGFPTEMSWPFIYTMDVPTVFSAKGTFKMGALPSFSNGKTLHKPNEISAEGSLKLLLSTKIQTKLGFFTPHNQERFTSGFDKSLQFYLPIQGRIGYNVDNSQVKIQVAPIEPRKNRPLIQYYTTPYTSKFNMLNLEPTEKEIKVIKTKYEGQYDETFGESNGLAFNVNYEGDYRFLDFKWLHEKISNLRGVGFLYGPYFESSLSNSKLVLTYSADRSFAHAFVFRCGHVMVYNNSNFQIQMNRVPLDKFNSLPEYDSKLRQELMEQWASDGIQNSETWAADASVQFLVDPAMVQVFKAQAIMGDFSTSGSSADGSSSNGSSSYGSTSYDSSSYGPPSYRSSSPGPSPSGASSPESSYPRTSSPESSYHEATLSATSGSSPSKTFYTVSPMGFSFNLNNDHPTIEYSISAAFSSSKVDNASRALLFIRKLTENTGLQPFQAGFSGMATFPNVHSLNFESALEEDPASIVTMELGFGANFLEDRYSSVIKWKQTEERRQFLKSSPQAQVCLKQMREGNYQLPACANLTESANLLDQVNVSLVFHNYSEGAQKFGYKLMGLLKHVFYYNFEETESKRIKTLEDADVTLGVDSTGYSNTVDGASGENKGIVIQAKFYPELDAVNVTMDDMETFSSFQKVKVDRWAREAFVVHPQHPLFARILGERYQWGTYRPMCTIDTNAASTFDKKIYPIKLGKQYHLMLTYLPTPKIYNQYHQQSETNQNQHSQNHRSRNQLNQNQQNNALPRQYEQFEQYSLLVRDSRVGNNKKEVLISLRNKFTNFRLLQIYLTPKRAFGSLLKTTVDVTVEELNRNRTVPVSNTTSYDVGTNGFIQIYWLEFGEVKVDVEGQFYVIYDGSRVTLSMLNHKFYGTTQGLCGTFNGETFDDFLTSSNCIVGDPEAFTESYNVEAPVNPEGGRSTLRGRSALGGKGNVGSLQGKDDGLLKCSTKTQIFLDVISDVDAGRSPSVDDQVDCTGYRPMVAYKQNNTVCFSRLPIPYCKMNCDSSDYVKQLIPMWCTLFDDEMKDLVTRMKKDEISPTFANRVPVEEMSAEWTQNCVEL